MQKNIEKILIRIQYFAVVEGQKIECKNVEEYILRNFQEFNADYRDWHDLIKKDQMMCKDQLRI